MTTNIEVKISVEGLPSAGKGYIFQVIRKAILSAVNSGELRRVNDYSSILTGQIYKVKIGKGRKCDVCETPMNTMGKDYTRVNNDGSVNCHFCGRRYEK